MLNWIIDFSLKNRFLVVLGALGFVVAGVFALRALDIDAFPDTTPVQVQINTIAPSLTPNDGEMQITARIEQELAGMPHLQEMRSVSQFGVSQVVVTFADGVDIYFARQQVAERLSKLVLPEGVARPSLGPISTGLGEVFHYVLSYKGEDLSNESEEERARKLTELRTLQDWVIKPKLRTVKGVAEVNSWGGYEKQYQVRIDPQELLHLHVSFDQVVQAVRENNLAAGGGNSGGGADGG